MGLTACDNHPLILGGSCLHAWLAGRRGQQPPLLTPRTASAPTLHLQGKEGVPTVLHQMRDYCISREDIDFITGKAGLGCCQPHPRCSFSIQSWCGHVHTHTNAWLFQCVNPPRSLPACPPAADVTKFKTKAAWGEDPMKAVDTQVCPLGLLGCLCWVC